jgi:PAS domain S-box-containing protein
MGHFHKEGKVLFPTALEVIPEGEWASLRAEFDGIGYCCFTPPPPPATREPAPSQPGLEEGVVELPTGSFSLKELEAVLNALPVDITFVDAQDRVRYFNQAKDRIFVRSKSVIGRTVQNCHPPKSVHIVNRIVEDFKAGRRDVAEFWINLGGRLVYIRYFPVRTPEGKYLGTLEVTQDITNIKAIQGERRLLDDLAAEGGKDG